MLLMQNASLILRCYRVILKHDDAFFTDVLHNDNTGASTFKISL